MHAETPNGAPPATAFVSLRGYGTVPAHLEVSRFPLLAWMARVVFFTVCWIGGTVATLVFTFDPFVASFPFVLGLGLVHGGVRGRYRVHAFHGVCPSCREPLAIREGSKISLPHPMNCYVCHHEPELILGPPGAYG